MTPQISMFYHPLYQPKPDTPMNVVVFGSGSGTNLEALLQAQKQASKPLFKIQALFTDRKCRIHDIAEREGLPHIYHSFLNFCQEQQQQSQHPQIRKQYDREIAAKLNACAYKHQFSIDLIVLAGYMRLLTSTFLESFPQKVINVHPADLSKVDSQGRRRYVGANAVYDALEQGESKTCSSVILVNHEVDGGPVLVTGPWVDYEEGYPVTKESAQRHQEKQKRLSDWPACIAAVEMIALGKLVLDRTGNVLLLKNAEDSV